MAGRGPEGKESVAWWSGGRRWGGGVVKAREEAMLTGLVIIEQAESLDDLLHGVTLGHLPEMAWRA